MDGYASKPIQRELLFAEIARVTTRPAGRTALRA